MSVGTVRDVVVTVSQATLEKALELAQQQEEKLMEFIVKVSAVFVRVGTHSDGHTGGHTDLLFRA